MEKITNLCKEIYTKQQLDSTITNRNYRTPLFELVVVPKELALKVEVELDDGFVLARYENTIKLSHSFGEAYLVQKVEEQRPDIVCAMDSVTIEGVLMPVIIHDMKIQDHTTLQ